jgi:hypothetical protein
MHGRLIDIRGSAFERQPGGGPETGEVGSNRFAKPIYTIP